MRMFSNNKELALSSTLQVVMTMVIFTCTRPRPTMAFKMINRSRSNFRSCNSSSCSWSKHLGRDDILFSRWNNNGLRPMMMMATPTMAINDRRLHYGTSSSNTSPISLFGFRKQHEFASTLFTAGATSSSRTRTRTRSSSTCTTTTSLWATPTSRSSGGSNNSNSNNNRSNNNKNNNNNSTGNNTARRNGGKSQPFSTASRRSFGSSSYNSSNNDNDDNWKVPEYIKVPEDQIDISFVRSSGAGGQNVNKVNTKVEVRLDVMNAYWIPYEVRERIFQQNSNRINNQGTLSIQAQEYRTQLQNRKLAISKLQDVILAAYPRPKQRKMRTGISKASKQRNKENKRRRSQVKNSRKSVNLKDY